MLNEKPGEEAPGFRMFFLLGAWLVMRGPYERGGRKRVVLRYVSTNRGTSSEMTEHRVCRVAASGCGFLLSH